MRYILASYLAVKKKGATGQGYLRFSSGMETPIACRSAPGQTFKNAVIRCRKFDDGNYLVARTRRNIIRRIFDVV